MSYHIQNQKKQPISIQKCRKKSNCLIIFINNKQMSDKIQKKEAQKQIQKFTKSTNQEENLFTPSNLFSSSQNWQQNFFRSTHTKENSTNYQPGKRSMSSHPTIEEIYGKIQVDDEIIEGQQILISFNKCSPQNHIAPQYERIFKINRQYSQKVQSDQKKKKNSNVAKHFIKHFILRFKKRAPSFFSKDQEEQDLLKETQKFFDLEIKKYKTNKNWNNNLEAMKKIFGENDDPKSKKRSFILRKMAQFVIRQDIIPEVLSNPQIKDMAFTYIYTLLIQIYRCQNSSLMERTQIV